MLSKSAITQFQSIVGKENGFTSDEDTMAYSYDAFFDTPVKPDIVVQPRTPEEIAAIVNLCCELELPITVRGAGTNLSGGTIPKSQGCVLLTTAMNRIIEVNHQDMYAVVETGVITADLAQSVEKHGYFYPPDPGSMNVSTLGGNVAENAGGLRGLKYGVTGDYLMGLSFIDIDGNLVTGGGRTVKHVSGFNLPGLMTGSEGLLGIITEMILKIVPQPKSSQSMLVSFDDLDRASETVSEIIARHVIPATLELMDNFTIQCVEEATGAGLPTGAAALLLIEVDGHPAQVEDEYSEIKKVCREKEGTIILPQTNEEKNKLWEARRKALSSLARIRPTLILEDATVPRSAIPEMMKAIARTAAKYDLDIGTFGHAGDGNLHPTILTDRRDAEEMLRVQKAIDDIFTAALKMGGTLSGEHGIGTAKEKYLEQEFGPGTIRFMRKLKSGLDKNNLLNPHKSGL